MSDRIRYNVDFEINQQQINKLKLELQNLQKMSISDFSVANPGLGLEKAQSELRNIKQSANELEQVFNKAFNTNLGSLNLKTLNNELEQLKRNGALTKINNDLAKVGITGLNSYQQMSSMIMRTNLQLKESHNILDKMATTLGNSFKWSAASSVVNRMAGSIQGAWNYAKSLDTSLNDIRIVSGKSANEMERFARTANQAAQRLGKSTTDYTNAALIYYQQGLGDQEAQKRAEVTLKTANVTGQSTRTVSEQLTSVWNGYNVSVEQSEAVIDKLAAVAATTASDLEELSTGMSKVASAANIMGVDIDQLNAQLATIVSVTRQAPESVGTALKTIYARMGDIEAGLDGETSLDQYTEKMAAMGVNVLNTEGKLRDMGEVIEEVGHKWPEMSREQQVALSQIMAGTRQYNNLLSLFNNWDMYENALKTSKSSLGTLQEQQETYMESTKAHIAQLDAAWERVFDAFIDNKGINGLIDMFTGITNGLANFIEALGGGGTALLTFGGIATQVFSKQITKSIQASINNFTAEKNNIAEIEERIKALQNLLANSPDNQKRAIQLQIQQLQSLKDNIKNLSVEQIKSTSDTIAKYGEMASQVDIVKEKIEQAKQFLKLGYDPTDAAIDDYLGKGLKEDRITGLKTELYGALSVDKQELQQSINSFKDLQDSANRYYTTLNNGANTTKAAERVMQNMRNMVNKAARDWSEYGTVSKESQEKLKEALIGLEDKQFGNIFNDSKNAEKLRNKFANFANVYKEVLKEVEAQHKNLESILANGGAIKYLEDVAKKENDVEASLQTFWDQQGQQQTIQGFVKMAGGLQQVASAALTVKFKHIRKIFTSFNGYWNCYLNVSFWYSFCNKWISTTSRSCFKSCNIIKNLYNCGSRRKFTIKD